MDLKKELKTRGLSTAGNKEELVERLNTYTQNLLGTGSGKSLLLKPTKSLQTSIPSVLILFTDIDGFGESITENDILEEDVLGVSLYLIFHD